MVRWVAFLLASLLCAQTPAQRRAPMEKQAEEAIAKGEPNRAVALWQDALRVDPQWRAGWWRLGTTLYQAEQPAAARVALEKLIALDPNAGAPWVVLGLCEFEMRDYHLASEHLQRGLSLGIPPELDLLDVARYHQALALLVSERFEHAQILLNAFAQKPDEYQEVVLASGLAALQLPLLPAVVQRMMDPAQLTLLRDIGSAQQLVSRRQGPEARKIYEQALTQYPGVPYLHLSYASLLVKLGDSAAAEAAYRKELEVSPKSILPRLGLGFLAMQSGEVEPAIPLAREAVELEPKSFLTHYLLGAMLLRTGKLDEALQALETARLIEPNSSRVRYTLSQVYQRLKRKTDADRERAAFQKLKPLEDSFREFGKLPASLFLQEREDAK